MEKKILVIGSWKTTHIRRFLTILCKAKEDDLVIDAFDPDYEDGQGNVCGVNHVSRITALPISRKIYSIRKVGTLLKCWKEYRTLEKILSSNEYDLVNIHSLPKDCLRLVQIAHKHNVKVLLTPFGSDVLRLGSFYYPMMRRAFDAADYVGTNTITGFCQTIKEKFSIDEAKFVNLGYGSETISAIIDMKGKYTKHQLAEMLGAPAAEYYICCGYSASKAQHQDMIIRALAGNAEVLPDNTCLLLPLSYGPDKHHLKNALPEICKQYNLKYYSIEEYLPKEEVAALRFISDLMIHIQPTDAYNASLQEFLLAGTEVINGSWLTYPSLEKYGLPYYPVLSLDTLADDIHNFFTDGHKNAVIHQSVIDEIAGNAWERKIKDWIVFYKRV